MYIKVKVDHPDEIEELLRDAFGKIKINDCDEFIDAQVASQDTCNEWQIFPDLYMYKFHPAGSKRDHITDLIRRYGNKDVKKEGAGLAKYPHECDSDV